MDPRIDPEIAAVVARLPESALGIDGMRAGHLASSKIVAGEGPSVARSEEILIPGPAGEILTHLYVPDQGDVRPPLLLYLHGGGWVLGSQTTFDPICRALANASGAAILYVEYRLAPENPFPAAVKDCWAALRWAEEHADELGCDPDRLGVAGDSSGGGLAAVMARRARDAGGPRLGFQLLVYPAIDPRRDTPSYATFAEGFALDAEGMRWNWETYLDGADPDDLDAAPARLEDASRLPPALVILAELDVLHDEGAAYARRMQDAGVPVRVHEVPGAIHGFWRWQAVSHLARETMEAAGRAVADGFAAG
jgi:acetyl esterase